MFAPLLRIRGHRKYRTVADIEAVKHLPIDPELKRLILDNDPLWREFVQNEASPIAL